MRKIAFAVYLVLAAAAARAAVPVAVIDPSRVSGVAPLSVFFDASSTTASGTSRPFHNLEYRWDFGDSGSGNWSTSGLSRNTAKGPVAAHVFETPGSYTVNLSVFDGTQSGAASVTITVQDPAVVYAGANTVCVSASSMPEAGADGCPAGAGVQQSADFDAMLAAHIGPNKRILFRRGDAFAASANGVITNSGPTTIGAYGAGAAPRVNATNLLAFSITNAAVNDLRLMDLDLVGSGASDTGVGINVSATPNNVAILRMTIREFGKGIIVQGTGSAFITGAILYESAVSNYYAVGGNAFFGYAVRSAFLGNRLGPVPATGNGEHLLRLQRGDRVAISHNILDTPNAGKVNLTIRAVPHVTAADDTRYIYVSDNLLIGQSNPTLMAIGPSADTTNEHISNFVVERNMFVFGPGAQNGLGVTASSVAIRGNIFRMSGALGHRGIRIKNSNTAGIPTPDLNEVYSNTFYGADTMSDFMAVEVGNPGTVTNTSVKNNLAYAPNDSFHRLLYLGAGAVGTAASNNSSDAQVGGTSPLFSVMPPVNPADFNLTVGSYGRGAGADVPVFSDYFGRARPLDGSQDLGAVEFAPDVDVASPSIPAGLVAVAVSSVQIDLSWTPSTDNVGVTGYRVFRDNVQIANGAGTSYSDVGLTASTLYSYTVAAYDAAGNTSSLSTSTSALTSPALDTAAPTVPAGLVAVAISSTQINLSWTASVDAVGVSGYRIFRGGVQFTTTTATAFSNTSLPPSTTYTYAVAAYDAAGNASAQSASISVQTSAETTPPSMPTGLSAVAVSSTQINLSWTASTDNVGVTGYHVFRGGVELTSTTATTFANSGLTPSTPYAYAVSAYDAVGNVSARSALLSTATLAAPDLTPPSVSITAPSNGATVSKTIVIGASASDNVRVVRIEFEVDGVVKSSDTSAPYAYGWNTKLWANGTHGLTARAYDAAGNFNSASISVTVKNNGASIRLVQDPGAALTTAASGGGGPSGLALFSIQVNTIIEPTFPVASVISAVVGMPSGDINVTLSRMTRDPSVFFAKMPLSLFGSQDFLNLDGSTRTVAIGGQIFIAEGIGNGILPNLGGAIQEPAGPAQVIVQAGGVTEEAKLAILPMPSDTNNSRSSAMRRQGLEALDAGRDIVMTSSGSLNSALVILPIDPALLAGRDLRMVRMAYFNPNSGNWEIIDNATVVGNTLQAYVTHFSLYAPVLLTPSAAAGLRSSLVYPNPAVGGQDPVIRAMMGVVDSVEITIYNVASRPIHSVTLSGAPTGVLDNEFYYDYRWSGDKASGVYFAVIHGKKSDGTIIRSRVKFAVVR